MHIPDSAVSPATSLLAGGAMLPVWYAAGRRLRESLTTRQVPLLAVGAAFCFAVMMFNIPVFGGTTVHPVGAGLMAVLLGPWAAVIGVTVALAIQALFFADGGVLALGANCFPMAFAMPFSAFLVYRLLAEGAPAGSYRRALAAGIGAYLGVNVAALLVAVMLGIQPALYHDAAGRALFFPFGLKMTLPAMLLPHLTVAGGAEAVVTMLAVRYLQAARIPLYGADDAAAAGTGGRRELLWVGLGVMAALSPLGLLATGDAWGEWSAEDLAKRAGYLPTGLAAAEETGWKGFHLLPDYLGERGPAFYVLAAVVGIVLIILLLLAVGRLLARRIDPGPPVPPGDSPLRERATLQPGQIPDWMRRGTGGSERPVSDDDRTQKEGPEPRSGRWLSIARRPDYIARTLVGIAEATRETVFAEKWARRAGLLQRLDPRAKILGLFGFVALTSFMHHAPSLLGLCALSVILAIVSRVPAGVLLRRVWLTVPLFVGAVTLPAVLNVVTPGPALLVLWRDPYLAVTAPGLATAGLLTLRVGTAVSFVVLLTLTTRWNDLLRGLRVLLVPRLFLVVLAMTYRYLAVMTQAASEMFVARRSRTVGHAGRGQERRFLGGAIGALFGRSLALTDEVHAAMLSRGWTGEARAMRPLRLTMTDLLWLTAMTLCGILAVLLEGGRG